LNNAGGSVNPTIPSTNPTNTQQTTAYQKAMELRGKYTNKSLSIS
jgi:hypothetical protein